jgi:protein-L-isoaspartate(D-aspartate) O-methyltransferase
MTIDLDIRRRCYAEEVQAVANLRSGRLVDALATVPRERFLPPGPWTLRSEADVGGGPRQTPDADPRHVYHNLAIGIDPSRQLFNGGPAVVARAIDALAIGPGSRVLHLGTGLGYYTALMGAITGEAGHVIGIEVDADLAARAAGNVASMPWVQVRQGDGTAPLDGTFDGILINAGVTHPRDAWLDALAPGGRLVLPLTATMPAMGPIGKGPMVVITRRADGAFDAETLSFVAIYSAENLRDESLNTALGQAMARGMFTPLRRLRRDAHERDAACWLHMATTCISTQ